MENKIVIQIKSVYGNTLIYPMNEQAKLFASIAGQKTLSKDHVEKIKQLGYSVEVQNAYGL